MTQPLPEQVECEHRWIQMPNGTALTRRVPFRFCRDCDREEWDNGVVLPGYDLRRARDVKSDG